MTTTLKDTNTIQAVTVPDAMFDNDTVARIVHVLNIGRAQLATDAQTFTDEVERLEAMRGNLPLGAAEELSRSITGIRAMAVEFQRYIEETDAILNVLEYLNEENVLAFVNPHDDDTAFLLSGLRELVKDTGRVF